ncbi:MAG TPA: hypothetical protein PLQ29_07865 [Spirochaetales bacterium]|nr:hypothetical protein [Spirochaetales bacterium]HPG86599.1 hypothetical protein [Spirochaetales bacterium]HPM73041.1 hypothetical protein [Spirochaetales bacterium]
MTIETRWLVYPDGERQETDRLLRVDELVDMNGYPLPLPPPSDRMIAYRVFKIRRVEERGELDVLQYLDLVPAAELRELRVR